MTRFSRRKHTDDASTSSTSKLEAGNKPTEYEYKDVKYKDWFTKKKYIPWWIALIVIAIVVALMTIYHKQIVDWLRPVSAKIRALSWGWVIPIIVLVVISFPPLFGHEIVAVLCGVVYGLWIGFGIVAAGTFIGEIATYFAFKYVLRNRAEKLEKTNLNYGALARITRDGKFFIVFIIRLSVIPSHFSTAVLATCGVSFWIFLIATFVTLPKQLVVVYLGVILENPGKGRLVSDVVLGITFVITLIAGIWIWFKLRKIRPILLDEQAQRKSSRQQLLQAESNASQRDPSFEVQDLGGVKPYGRSEFHPAGREDAYEMDSQQQPYSGRHNHQQYGMNQGNNYQPYGMDDRANYQPYQSQELEAQPYGSNLQTVYRSPPPNPNTRFHRPIGSPPRHQMPPAQYQPPYDPPQANLPYSAQNKF